MCSSDLTVTKHAFHHNLIVTLQKMGCEIIVVKVQSNVKKLTPKNCESTMYFVTVFLLNPEFPFFLIFDNFGVFGPNMSAIPEVLALMIEELIIKLFKIHVVRVARTL